MISKTISINSRSPKAFGELFGFKRIQAYKLGVQEVDGRAVAPLDWVTPVCAVLALGCSWALHFCQAHVNIALRTGLGRHRLLFDKTPAPLLSDAEPAVSVYVDNGGILSTQRGKANTLRRQLERKLGEVALPTHEAEAETDDLEMLGMRLHDGRAARTRKRAWRLKLATEELLKVGFATGVQMASLIGHFSFVFLLRRPCLSVFCTIYQFILRAGVRRRSLWNCVRRELQATSGLLVLAFSDLSLQVQQQVYCSDACPQGWAAHVREWPLQEVERQLAWNERWRFKWTEGQPARSRALNNSNEQSDLDGDWAIEPDFPEIDPSLLAPSSWQLLKRGRYTYKEPIHLKEARAMHFNARRVARRCMTRGRVVLMLCDNMGVVLACEKGRCTDLVLLRILRRLAAISLVSGARFRYRWVPSELCPSDEGSRWYDREQDLEESRREPRFATKRRSSQHGTSQRSGEWARATRRARRAAQDHPAELAYIWNLCRSARHEATSSRQA